MCGAVVAERGIVKPLLVVGPVLLSSINNQFAIRLCQSERRQAFSRMKKISWKDDLFLLLLFLTSILGKDHYFLCQCTK